MLNICQCGAQDGYPHARFCPYPLYHATDAQWYKWEQTYQARVKAWARKIPNEILEAAEPIVAVDAATAPHKPAGTDDTPRG